MDGLDLATLDELFNGSPIESDEDDSYGIRSDYIGTSSTAQTSRTSGFRATPAKTRTVKRKSRSERERDLELKLLNPNSIRTQILKQSLRDGHISSGQGAQMLALEDQPNDFGSSQMITKTFEPETTAQPVASNHVENAQDEEVVWSEMVTQEKQTQETCNNIISVNQKESNGTLAQEPPEPTVEGFFSKKRKSPQSEDNEDLSEQQNPISPHKSKSNSNLFLSQEEDEEFFDASAGEGQNNEPQQQELQDDLPQHNEESLIEQGQSGDTQAEVNSEDFDCPYCFKPFKTFSILERHIETCYLKTPIDVNKQLFRSSQQTSQGISSFFTRATRLSSQTSVKKGKGRRSPNLSSRLQSSRSSNQLSFRSKASSPDCAIASNSNDSIKPKLSFYQRFIESNSQSLTQSVKVDPLQCPYCLHGFLNFSNLETHVVMCTKQRTI